MASSVDVSPTGETQVITTNDLRKCRAIMQSILEEKKPIAVDAEGVRLGKDGRLTLLQIAKMDGTVYLIDPIDSSHPDDAALGKDFFNRGQIKKVLESIKIVKVMHGCISDSAALHFQFDIHINNIFDTQAAHIILEQDVNHVTFPKKLRLDLLAEKYIGATHGCVELKNVCDDNPTFWQERPLTREMISYAAEDVRILVPELYKDMKDRLESGRVWKEFKQVVLEESLKVVNPGRAWQKRHVRELRAIRPLFRNMEQRYQPSKPVADMEEDERRALSIIPGGSAEWTRSSDCIRDWERDLALQNLEDWKQQVETHSGQIHLEPWALRRVKRLTHHPVSEVAGKAADLMEIAKPLEATSGGQAKVS